MVLQHILHNDGQPFHYQITIHCNLEMYMYYYIVHVQKTLYLHAHDEHNISMDFNYLLSTYFDVYAENVCVTIITMSPNKIV